MSSTEVEVGDEFELMIRCLAGNRYENYRTEKLSRAVGSEP